MTHGRAGRSTKPQVVCTPSTELGSNATRVPAGTRAGYGPVFGQLQHASALGAVGFVQREFTGVNTLHERGSGQRGRHVLLPIGERPNTEEDSNVW